nr:hypothetical protein [Actinomycetales bacterium]
MVIAISFLEAPLKFRAPGVTVALGLGIGRIVFRAVNTCEVILALIVTGSLVLSGSVAAGNLVLAAAVAILVIQLAVVRPALRRRSARVLSVPETGPEAGPETGGRSRAHWVYVGFEAVKAITLLMGALLILGVR